MSKTLDVIKFELKTTLSRRGFLIGSFVLPWLAILVLTLLGLNQGGGPAAEQPSRDQSGDLHQGIVDLSGLVQTIPEDLPPGRLTLYADEAAAQAAMAAGEIETYYLVPADYLQDGNLWHVYPPGLGLTNDRSQWEMHWTLLVNLVGGDIREANRFWNVASVELVDLHTGGEQMVESDSGCSRPGMDCRSNLLVRFLPVIMVALYFITFQSSSQMLLRSISQEKENRTIELLLASVRPRQLLMGKILGLGIAGLMQAASWVAAIFVAVRSNGEVLNLVEGFSFPADILIWGIVLFAMGYMMYGALIAGVGVMVPNMKEAGQAQFVVMTPLLIAYLVGLLAPMSGATDRALPVALSYFPLTSPILMMMRVTTGEAAAWEVAVAAALILATALLFVRGASRLFVAQYMLSGQPFRLRRYLAAMAGRG